MGRVLETEKDVYLRQKRFFLLLISESEVAALDIKVTLFLSQAKTMRPTLDGSLSSR